MNTTTKTPMELAAESLPRSKPIANSWPWPTEEGLKVRRAQIEATPLPSDTHAAAVKVAERMGVLRKTAATKKAPAKPARLTARERALVKPLRMLEGRGIADETTMCAVRAALKLVEGAE